MPLPSSVISGLFGLGQSVLGGSFGAIGNSMQFNQNSYFQERQFQQQKQMFDMANNYNAPKNVLARLREAGINPNFGLGTINNPAQPLSGASAAVNTPDFSGVYSGIPSILPNALSLEQARGQQYENKVKPEMLAATLEQVKKQNNLTDAQIGQISRSLKCLEDKTAAECKQLYAAANLAVEQLNVAKQEGRKLSLENVSRSLVSDLASKYGIIVDQGNFTALMTGLMSPHGADLIRSTISKFFGNLTSPLIDATLSGLKDFGRKAIKTVWPWSDKSDR